MRILVTGALGHIGSSLIHTPSEHELVLVDNFATQRFASLFHLNYANKVEFYELDARHLGDSSIPNFSSLTHVVHLAATTDAAGNANNRNGIFDNNFEGTKRVADLCLKFNIPLIFPSTTSVYGSQSELVDESCKDLYPQSPYAECKIAEEQYLTELSKSGLKMVILRLGTIHGASIGMRFHTAVNKFVFQSKLKVPLTVWKTALHQKRPYLSLADAVQSFNHVIAKGLFDGEVYNVVTNNWNVQDIINAIKKHSLDEPTINLVDSPIMNQLSYEVSSKKFESAGFKFTGDLERDIKETLELLIGLN